MRTFDDLRLLGDQVLVRCLGTADMQGRIHIPQTAQDFRKIHRSGGDYLHRGEVVLVGPGDKMVLVTCRQCGFEGAKLETAKNWKCGNVRNDQSICGFDLDRRSWLNKFLMAIDTPECSRAEMPVSVGDIVLYENRRDAKLQPRRFPSLGLDEDSYVILLAEQHVLAVLD